MILAAFLLGATMLDGLTQGQLDAISARCHAPKSWLVRRGGGIHIQPPPTAKYEKVDCLLGLLRRQGATNMGFVGNECSDAPEH